MGERPCYIDGHQHVHLYPCLTETIASVMEEFSITKTRFLSEDMNEVSWMNTNPRKSFRQLIYHNVSLSLSNHHAPDPSSDSCLQQTQRFWRIWDRQLHRRHDHDSAANHKLLFALSSQSIQSDNDRIDGFLERTW